MTTVRLPKAWVKPIAEKRLLMVSPFDERVGRASQETAQIHNEFVAALANQVFVAYASPGGKTEALCRKIIEWRKPLLMFDSPENASHLARGARASIASLSESPSLTAGLYDGSSTIVVCGHVDGASTGIRRLSTGTRPPQQRLKACHSGGGRGRNRVKKTHKKIEGGYSTTYYYGTSDLAARWIMENGFDINLVSGARFIGRGVYLSEELWAVAILADHAFLRHRSQGATQPAIMNCRLTRGTRFLKVEKPEQQILNSMRREFGRNIFRYDFYKFLPENKSLTRDELATVLGYIFHKHLGPRTFLPSRELKPNIRKNDPLERYQEGLAFIHEQLRRFGLHGYRVLNPCHEEIVIFNPSRVQPVSWEGHGGLFFAISEVPYE